MDSTFVIAGHGATLYKILDTGIDDGGDKCDGLGIDTKDGTYLTAGEYSNLWKVSIDADGKARLDKHLILNFGL